MEFSFDKESTIIECDIKLNQHNYAISLGKRRTVNYKNGKHWHVN